MYNVLLFSPMTKKRSPDHSSAVQAALLKASASLFITRGYHATTVRDIAAQAGMTTGSLYHFFANKEDILKQLIRDVFAVTTGLADSVASGARTPHLALSYELAMQIELITANERLASLYNVAHTLDSISSLILQLAHQRFAALLPATGDSAYALAVTAKSLMMGLTQERLISNRLSLDQRLSVLLQTLWSGLGPAAPDINMLTRQVRACLDQNRSALQGLLPGA